MEELAKMTSKVRETIGKRGPLKRAREICPFGPDSCTTRISGAPPELQVNRDTRYIKNITSSELGLEFGPELPLKKNARQHCLETPITFDSELRF